jgi:hypothetical protein
MRYEERTRKEYAIVCNRCGDRGPWAFSKQEARELAEEYGWRLKDGPLCPECQRREEREEAVYDLLRDPLTHEAYQYAMSFPREYFPSGPVVKGPAEVDGLPTYILYFWYLARHGEADYHFPGGVAAYRVRGAERTLFPTLRRNAIAVWEENGFVRYSEGSDVAEATGRWQ